MRAPTLGFAAILLTAPLRADPAAAAKEPDVAGLIERLGSEDLGARKAAYVELCAMDRCPEEVKKAREETQDPEVRAACERLILRFERRDRLAQVRDPALQRRLRDLLEEDPTRCILIGKAPPPTKARRITKVRLRVLPLSLKEQVLGPKRGPISEEAEIVLEAVPDQDGFFWFPIPPGEYFRTGHGLEEGGDPAAMRKRLWMEAPGLEFETAVMLKPAWTSGGNWKVQGLEFEAKANHWVVLPEIR